MWRRIVNRHLFTVLGEWNLRHSQCRSRSNYRASVMNVLQVASVLILTLYNYAPPVPFRLIGTRPAESAKTVQLLLILPVCVTHVINFTGLRFLRKKNRRMSRLAQFFERACVRTHVTSSSRIEYCASLDSPPDHSNWGVTNQRH